MKDTSAVLCLWRAAGEVMDLFNLRTGGLGEGGGGAATGGTVAPCHALPCFSVWRRSRFKRTNRAFAAHDATRGLGAPQNSLVDLQTAMPKARFFRSLL